MMWLIYWWLFYHCISAHDRFKDFSLVYFENGWMYTCLMFSCTLEHSIIQAHLNWHLNLLHSGYMNVKQNPCHEFSSWKILFMKYIYSYKLHVYELRHDKINKVSVRPAKTRSAWAFVQSDQSLCCLHEESLGPFLPIECTVKTLIRLAGCPGWSESSLGTHSLCWFCHVAAPMYLFCEEIHLNIWQF